MCFERAVEYARRIPVSYEQVKKIIFMNHIFASLTFKSCETTKKTIIKKFILVGRLGILLQ